MVTASQAGRWRNWYSVLVADPLASHEPTTRKSLEEVATALPLELPMRRKCWRPTRQPRLRRCQCQLRNLGPSLPPRRIDSLYSSTNMSKKGEFVNAPVSARLEARK